MPTAHGYSLFESNFVVLTILYLFFFFVDIPIPMHSNPDLPTVRIHVAHDTPVGVSASGSKIHNCITDATHNFGSVDSGSSVILPTSKPLTS